MRASNKNAQTPKKDKEGVIVGIHVIEAIVNKVTSGLLDTSQALSAVTEILWVYRYLPKEWRKKAHSIFRKIWDKKKIIISTNPEIPKQIYTVSFDDERINLIMKHLPETDKSIMYQGKSVLDLNKRGLHSDATIKKDEIQKRYGHRGLNIVNLISTGDITLLLEEINDFSKTKEVLKVFDWWAQNYTDVALMVSREDLDEPDRIGSEIIEMCKLLQKDYVLIYFLSNLDEILRVQTIVNELVVKEKIVKPVSFKMNIEDVGFIKSLRVIIRFK